MLPRKTVTGLFDGCVLYGPAPEAAFQLLADRLTQWAISHERAATLVQALQLAQAHQWEITCFISTDTLLRDDFAQQLKTLADLRRRAGWDLLYLGARWLQYGPILGPLTGIWQVDRCSGPFAFLARAKSLPVLQQVFEQEAHRSIASFDPLQATDLCRGYLCHPLLAMLRADCGDTQFSVYPVPLSHRDDFVAHCQEARKLQLRLARSDSRQKLLLQNRLELGDCILMTALLRELTKVPFFRRYAVSVQCNFPEVFQHLPGLMPLSGSPDLVFDFSDEYQDYQSIHLLQFATEKLSAMLREQVPTGPLKPWLVLSEEEMQPPLPQPYWVMMAGGKQDCTTKLWPYYQEVVDALEGRVQFVQVGGRGRLHLQPKLQGVIDRTGQTSIREYIRLIAHSQGIVAPVTSAVHIAAAFDIPAVVIAGGREDPVARYPRHQYLHNLGTLDCCRDRGCWKQRIPNLPARDAPPPHPSWYCEKPLQGYATCMRQITATDVVRGVEHFIGPADQSAIRMQPARVGVCSFYTPDIAEWADPCSQSVENYCYQHRYTFIRPDTHNAPTPRWIKPFLLLQHLHAFDWLAWIDADCLIEQYKFQLLAVAGYGKADLYITRDENGLNNGVMLFRNTPASYQLLRRWRDSFDDNARFDRNSDQDYLVRCIAEMQEALKVLYVPKRVINAYTYEYQAGDWLVHFAGHSRREELIKQWLVDGYRSAAVRALEDAVPADTVLPVTDDACQHAS